MDSLGSRLVTALLPVAGLTLALAACHRDASTAQLSSAAPAASAAAATKRVPIPDAEIARATERHLLEDSALRTEHVRVAVTQGICTLSGSVGNLLAKERALRVAETLKGIRAIIDQIEVTPAVRTDEQLKSDVTRELHDDVATRPHAIGVAAKDGRVTLSGIAGSWQEKILFAQVAKTVRGVKSIGNEITVDYATVPSESEIAADVKHRIASDVWLDGDVIDVKITGQTVHLKGVVGSVAEKSRARSDGWMVGVASVDDSGVAVDWAARDEQRHATDYQVRSDDEIAKAVRAAFRLDPRLKTLVPQVAVKNGFVVLSGVVDSPKARRAATLDAKDTVGVWSVRNEVLLQPAGQPTDAEIERGVKRALSRDLLLPDAAAIRASSTKGKVILEGAITSGFERFDAIEDAASTPGVTEVVDGLSIKRSPADIKASIDDRLYWDATVERDRVAVAVAPDGVATLSGTLDSWNEIRAAVDDAVWGGATSVVNTLQLKKRAPR